MAISGRIIDWGKCRSKTRPTGFNNSGSIGTGLLVAFTLDGALERGGEAPATIDTLDGSDTFPGTVKDVVGMFEGKSGQKGLAIVHTLLPTSSRLPGDWGSEGPSKETPKYIIIQMACEPPSESSGGSSNP